MSVLKIERIIEEDGYTPCKFHAVKNLSVIVKVIVSPYQISRVITR